MVASVMLATATESAQSTNAASGLAQSDAVEVEPESSAGQSPAQNFVNTKRLAEGGDAKAQYDLSLLRKAAEQGNPSAQMLLGLMYELGRGDVAKDAPEAIKWFRKAAEQGDTRAQVAVGRMLRRGEGVARDLDEALKWFRMADTNRAASFNLGLVYWNGEGVPKDEAAAIRYFRKAADGGGALQEYWLWWAFTKGGETTLDATEAAKWLAKLESNKNFWDVLRLGQALYAGDDVPKDRAEALKWFKRAAELEKRPSAESAIFMSKGPWAESAVSLVARMYVLQEAGPLDEAEAEAWFRKVARFSSAEYREMASYYFAEKEYVASAALLRIAAALGDAESQSHLGAMFEKGEGVSKDAVEAVKWFRKAADAGLAEAQYNLGLMFAKGEGVSKDAAEAVKWFRKAADAGLAEAQHNLGAMYVKGEGVSKDATEALKWFRKAADQGFALAQNNLGIMYGKGEGVSKDAAAAVTWYRKAAEQGFAPAQFNLGCSYGSGWGVPQDTLEAAKWYRKAAEQNDVNAQVNLGNAYANGEGVPKDVSEAVKWYRKAVEQGFAPAQYELGSMYAKGEGVPNDAVEAVKWYRNSADQGYAPAQYGLGLMYANGEGVSKDAVEAVKWYRKAADQGNAPAQCILGFMCINGEGVSKDAAEALKWFRKAADQGFAMAQNNLGVMYVKGEGVKKDVVEALRWYRKAADQGEPLAQSTLGLMYYNGTGVPKDDVEAYMWLSLAAAGGAEGAAANRSLVERNMSREEIVEAQQRSRAFVPRPESQATDASLLGPEGFAAPSQSRPKSAGSGFFLSEDGYFLSNYHVVEGASRIAVLTKDGLLPAQLVRSDAANDLVLLKVAGSFKSLPLVSSRGVKLGETVFTMGFPNVQLQGFEPKLTKGEINSLSGAQDDPRYFQVSVAVQPGNSGGPLVNESGRVIGIVAARLSEMLALRASGALPQNVNYAVKSSYALVFLESVAELAGKLKEPGPASKRQFDVVVSEVTEAVALVLAY